MLSRALPSGRARADHAEAIDSVYGTSTVATSHVFPVVQHLRVRMEKPRIELLHGREERGYLIYTTERFYGTELTPRMNYQDSPNSVPGC